MQVIAEILLGFVIVVVIIPALIAAVFMGCWGRARKEKKNIRGMFPADRRSGRE